VKQEGKVARQPFGGSRLKLQLSAEDDQGFKDREMVPRWINDQDGRIQQALGGGYGFVAPEHATSLGQGAIHQGNSDEGSKVSKIVSRGEPVIRAYLMEIPLEYWKEDQASKEEVNARVDEALAAGGAGGASIENQYGSGVTYSH
jgi:hypothetical protein